MERYNGIPHTELKQTPRSSALNLFSREVIKIKGFDSKPIMKMKTRDEVVKINQIQ